MISRVSIKNFKSFQFAEINLTKLNLFTGLNGMGKSTFIQALLLLKQSSAHLLPEKGLHLKSYLINIGKGKDAYSIHADDNFISFEVDDNYEPAFAGSYEFVAESDVLPLNKIDRPFYNERARSIPLFTGKFIYLKAERIAPKHTYEADFNDVKSERHLGYRGENVPLFIALNKLDPISLDSVKHPLATSNTLLSHLDAWMNEITPGTHVVSTYYSDLDLVKLCYQFDNGEDVTPEFSPVNVGFGFTYTLPVITAILSARPGDLIIIENPESHLHPQGQAKLGELLSKAAHDGVQLIIESHSDHLLNGIRVSVKNNHLNAEDLSVFFFERNAGLPGHITSISQPIIDENGRIDNQPKGFFDEYGKQLDSLLKE